MSSQAQTEATDGPRTDAGPEASRPPAPAVPAVPAAPAVPDARDAQGKPFGRYRLLQELGHGGMGVVWKAWDTHLRRHVALKQIRVRDVLEGHALERFLREIQLAARLQHPGIVRVLDAGRRDGLPYFTTELIAGKTLEDLVNAMRLAVPQAVRCVKAIGEALEYAHRQGVIHRDIKPGNVLIDTDGRPHLMDFGLAKEFLEAHGGDGRRPVTTNTCAIIGTPDYMSPEQAVGPSQDLGPATDQFSLGVVLYHLITGKLPFAKASLRQLFVAIAEEDPAPPSRHNPRVHRDLETICLKAMEKEPARRYPSVGAMTEDLGRFLDGEPIQARPLSGATRLWRRAVKHRAMLVPSLAALLLGGTFAWYAADQGARVRREVATALASARALREEERVEDARDAYLRVLAFDAGHGEAAAGVAWARGRLTERDAAAERARREASARVQSALAREKGAEDAEAAAREAEREAQERAAALAAAEADAHTQKAAAAEAEEQARLERERAERLLQKPALLRAVLARWEALAPSLARIEAIVTDARLAPEARRARSEEVWPALQRFVDETPPEPGSQAAARALAGWARWRSGHAEEGLRWMRQAYELDPESPYGPLLEGLAALSEALAGAPIVPPPLPESGASAGARAPDAPGLARHLDAAAERAEATAGAPVWGEAAAAVLRRAIDGGRALLAGKPIEAEAGLTALLAAGDLPVTVVEVRFARAKARQAAGRFSEAAADLVEVARARPGAAEVRFAVAEAHLGTAAHGGLRGTDQARAFEQAIDSYGQALALRARWPDATAQRGLALWGLARTRARLGELPDSIYERAEADFDRALDEDASLARGWLYRGLLWASRGDDALARGWSPRAPYGRAVAELAQAADRDAGLVCVAPLRGRILLRLADAEWHEQGAGRTTYELALAELDRALAADPERPAERIAHAWARIGLGRVLDALGEGVEAEHEWQSAVTELKAMRSDDEANAEVEEALGWAQVRLAEHRLADKLPPKAHVEEALQAFDRVLKADAESASAWHGRGAARLVLATALFQARALEGVVEDFDKALARDPKRLDVHLDKARALMLAFEVEKPTAARWDPALAQLDLALKQPCSPWRVHAGRGLLYELRGQFPQAVQAYEEAVRLAGDAVPRLARQLAGARAREDAARHGIRPTRLTALLRGARAMARDDHVTAWSQYEAAEASKSDLERQTALRPWVALALVHLARIYAAGDSLAPQGADADSLSTRTRASYRGQFPYTKEDPEGRQRATERAFALLARAIKLGYGDRKALEAEPDFGPLRRSSASRWKNLFD